MSSQRNNTVEKNYYEVLSVARDVDEAEIKKACRKLVCKYHPNVDKELDAAERTVEINRAYETPSDKEKRAEYDEMSADPYGRSARGNPFGQGDNPSGNGFNGGGFRYERHEGEPFGTGDFNFEDLFSSFHQSHIRSERPRDPIKGEDQHAELSIDIYAAYIGTECGMTLNVPTLDEYGRAVYRNKTLNVKILKGIAEGQQIRLVSQGLPGYNGGENGDLYLKIKFHDQPGLYVKNRKDVHQTIDIKPWEAVLGGKIIVSITSGRPQVNLPANSQSGENIRLKGKGIPTKEAGDLYFNIHINVPPVESEANRAAQEKLAEHFAAKQA